MKNRRLEQVLENRPDNYILPFFWQHGETEELLREGMARISESSIGAVCVESRPHPDFLGEKWWQDLDVIMDEAKKRGMRVWVLDDAHFPSGMCNGKITDDSPYGKEYLTHVYTDVPGPLKGHAFMVNLAPGERLLGVVMGKLDRSRPDVLTQVRDLTHAVSEGKVYADIPEGTWSIMVLKTTRRGSGRRDYINPLDADAVRFFLDTVYEPHYARYGADFGGAFAGFFSDEPEIGNGSSEHGHHLRAGQPDINLPWGRELEGMLRESWGRDFSLKLASLFAQVEPGTPHLLHDAPTSDRAAGETEDASARRGLAFSAANRVRFTDFVSQLYGRNFCGQIGHWCRDHGVEYIGHVIEDDGRHAQLGLGTAHFFRALWGEDMSGIDVVLQQLRPELDDFAFHTVGGIGTYNGEFFHYGLAKLGASLAKLDAKKRGRTMCEVFGAYGWAEGLKQMKWILDHMLVNGVNWFVPHAFTMKDFPDPDCPPHFYARGNNPQFPYFRLLMEYTNRVSHLISRGCSRVNAALLYTAEQEWAGEVLQFEKAAREMTRVQIDFTVVPGDYLAQAKIENGKLSLAGLEPANALASMDSVSASVGLEPADAAASPDSVSALEGRGEADAAASTDSVSALVVCGGQWLPEGIARSVIRAARQGIRVFVYGPCPAILGANGEVSPLEGASENIHTVPEGELAEALREYGCFDFTTAAPEPWLRSYRYSGADADYLLLFNEAAYETIDTGLIFEEAVRKAFRYDPWENRIFPCECGAILHPGKAAGTAGADETACTEIPLTLAAGEMQILVFPHEPDNDIDGNGVIVVSEQENAYKPDAGPDAAEAYKAGKRKADCEMPEAGEGSGEEIRVLPEAGWQISLREAGKDGCITASWNTLGDIGRQDKLPYFSGTMWYRTTFVLPEKAALSTAPEFTRQGVSAQEEERASAGKEKVPAGGGPHNPACKGNISECTGSALGGNRVVLELGEVYETASVLVNGKEAGVRLARPYRFDITGLVKPGENRLEIEVVNTLVHSQRDYLSMTMPMEPSGLIGPVILKLT